MAARIHLLCTHHDQPSQDTLEANQLRELEILAGQYRLGVETQMHFNELILRTRTLGSYAAILVMGAALLLRSQYPNAAPFVVHIGACVINLSAAAVIALFGPVLLLIVYLLDRRYYLRLLAGASMYVYAIEDAIGDRQIAGVSKVFSQGRTIQHRFGPRMGASTKFVNGAYAVVLVGELMVIFLLVVNQ